MSTDDAETVDLLKKERNYSVPFLRPDELATDHTSTREVLIHCIDHYAKNGMKYNTIILLQPTSSFRSVEDLKMAMDLFSSDLDMLVSVKETKANPYFSLFEENEKGFLRKSKSGNYTRRQDCPKVYEYNGAIYIIKASTLLKKELSQFKKVKKYVMSDLNSIDIDTPLDWAVAEYFISKRNGL